VSTPNAAAFDTIAVSGLAYALSGSNFPLPKMIAAEAKKHWLGDSGAPRAQFLEIPSLHPNSLGSFLGRDYLQDMQSLLGEELTEPYGPSWRSTLEGEAIRAIATEGEQETGWFFLAALYGSCPAPHEASALIDDALSKVDLRKLVEEDRNSQRLMLALANRIPHVKSEVARSAISSSLMGLAEWYGAHDGTEEEASWLMNLVLVHACPTAAGRSTVAHFQEFCTGVAERFPKFAGACRYTIDRFCYDLPIEKATEYWPLALTLRAIDWQ
jgi:hypothetical protein